VKATILTQPAIDLNVESFSHQLAEQRIFQIRICCDRDFPSEDSRNTRELGLMIFSIGLG